MKAYKVLTINPGSTSTKVVLSEGNQCLYSRDVSHEANELEEFKTLPEQLPYRRDAILKLLKKMGISLEDVDVFVGRGGGLLAVEGGTHGVTDLMLEHARAYANGAIHPAALGPQLVHESTEAYGAKTMVVDPSSVDKFQELACMTGIKRVYRIIRLYALNLKETAIHHSRDVVDRVYEKCSYVAYHIGRGISVSAHCGRKTIDGYDTVGGEGPMAPTRRGGISIADLLKYMETSGLGVADMRKLCTRTGGFINHAGISDTAKLAGRATSGGRYAEMLWDSVIHQVEKYIDSIAAALHGQVDGILLGGDTVHNQDLVRQITDTYSFTASVTAYPGGFETETMATGAIRVLGDGRELRAYTGKPV